jgi:molecular chaperone GrpE
VDAEVVEDDRSSCGGRVSEKRLADEPEGADDRRPAGVPDSDSEAAERAAAESEQAAQRVDEDLDEMGKVQQERDEYLDLAQRTRADFENYRRRVAGETAEALARGKAELAREVIPAIDNLERALQAAGVPPAPDRPVDGDPPSREVSAKDALAQGVALVYRELSGSLERAGVESYDPTGERFDPAMHEALSTRAEEGAAPGIVLETLDRGYRLDGQVLRPARVVVSE